MTIGIGRRSKPKKEEEVDEDAVPSAKKAGGVNENLIAFFIKLTPNMQVSFKCDVTCRVTCDVWRVTCVM